MQSVKLCEIMFVILQDRKGKEREEKGKKTKKSNIYYGPLINLWFIYRYFHFVPQIHSFILSSSNRNDLNIAFSAHSINDRNWDERNVYAGDKMIHWEYPYHIYYIGKINVATAETKINHNLFKCSSSISCEFGFFKLVEFI